MTKEKTSNKIVRLILGDQLNSDHSWYKKVDEHVVYALMEIRSETDYVTHHIQKVTAFFAAMRQFAEHLKQMGHQVIYIKLGDVKNKQTFSENCNSIIHTHSITHFQYQLPDEYRLDATLKKYCGSLKIPHTVFDSAHFLTTRNELGDFFKGKKTFLMESFYRYMRKKNDLLMQGTAPLTGKWNHDEANRKKLPRNHKAMSPLYFENKVDEIVSEIKKAGVVTIGNIDSQNFIWPSNRKQSLDLLDYFVKFGLPYFGTYQDAMTPGDWSLYHSRLSFSLNCKLISPLEVIRKAIEEWNKRQDEIEFNQLEGFVRQILGWREYMRGIYWLKMPEYATLNYFNHSNQLPQWYWTGKTKMNCLKHAIGQSLNHSYAHHIQRLMVTGNFALLAGVHPDEVDRWYLGIYIDAIDWVEITNTRGMSQFADGGIVGTKPYVSSAAYIDKMSDYCQTCYYNKAKKTGDKACPFNSLYWNFYDCNESKLAANPRIGMMYNVWKRMNPQAKSELLQQAEYYLKHIDSL